VKQKGLGFHRGLFLFLPFAPCGQRRHHRDAVTVRMRKPTKANTAAMRSSSPAEAWNLEVTHLICAALALAVLTLALRIAVVW
jgi:hypothetical protein